MGFQIVQAGLEHLDEVAELLHQYRQFYGVESYYPDCRHFLFDRMTKHESVVYLAWDTARKPAKAVGFCQLYPSFSSVSLTSIWILNDLYVIPEARQHGVGKALMEQARALAEMTESKGLVLETAPDNVPAKQLYASLGFQKDDVFEHYVLPL